MAVFLESYTLPVLIFFLEILVYLENLWYEAIWSRWQPSRTTLDKLILYKEDEIWQAVIYGNNGDVRKIFEDLTNSHAERGTPSHSVSDNGGVSISPSNSRAASTSGNIEAGVFFRRPKTKLQKAVETEVLNGSWGYDMGVQARLEAIADRLANSRRRLSKKEINRTKGRFIGKVSILWMAIHQGYKSDVDYLLAERSQKLDLVNTFQQNTVLQEAVSQGDCDLVRKILENSSFTSPEKYINSGDYRSRTALHNLVCKSVSQRSPPSSFELENTLEIFGLLSEYGANVNALDGSFMTPLHSLLLEASWGKFWRDVGCEYKFLVPLLDSLLLAGAEVQTKDKEGNSPLHIACELQDHEAIEKLVLNGADPETLNRHGKTPRRIFHDIQGSDKDFWRRMTILSRERQTVGADVYAPSRKLSQRHDGITKARMAICRKSPVHLRYQKNDHATESRNPLHWTAGDISVSEVLYPKSLSKGTTFLAECDKECQCAWNDLFQQPREVDHIAGDNLEQEPTARKSTAVDSGVTLAKGVWRWVNFPANNITWIRELIETNFNIDATAWNFFEKNVKIHNARNNGPRIRTPHAYKMSKDATISSKNEGDENTQNEPMVSIVIPFIDIEVQSEDPCTARQDEEAYPPFTGLDGVQMPQTLDQTSINAESQSKLRCKENQVIYRWSQKQGSVALRKLPLEWRVRDPVSYLAFSLFMVRRRAQDHERYDARNLSLGSTGKAGRDEGADFSARMQSIRKERRPKWLMVRQLWLWKLNNGTILTAIPSRTNMCMADDLLETTREGVLHNVSSSDDLMKHIVKEAIIFPDKFMRAGLGEHILDIFEGEIASEADEEATFYNNFTQNDWDSKHANRAISCTWRVKDIRDELGLIRKVFLSQLEVIRQFSKVLMPQQTKTSGDSEYVRTLVAELEGMIKRIKFMDSEAVNTLESLNNITQAMLAQASLKEAESARLMNFIILPFTIVTVIFTPLSFMTSLFAVNSDGFPHNKDGELRIPSDWFWRRMVIGEFGTLVPLVIFVLFLYYSRRGRRNPL
ncbi:uncharacterized protein FFUJ_03540 [Fusarium fujikuroi IMI 58289]|uniref:Uncharacterized protein n=1 Tax=Gibberella fujikuroi (strain CBS 195.34 / IMI 58289 / NRRL A-6831) TaxID=1279085 RepID=S0DW66_GIBF5|nr:uncharacterized protein FFUJ_03540 [Fusarium fujikuroi IMI 58289]CCT66746.1 uncharacterized protein FFUJ_03540 [Fusarium fujikuroi IMI 58289]